MEAGGLSLLAKYLKDTGYSVSPCLGDFRYSLDSDAGAADIMLALEVFEHVKDQTSNLISDIDILTFRESTDSSRNVEEFFDLTDFW